MNSNMHYVPTSTKFAGIANYVGYGSVVSAVVLLLVSLKLMIAGATNKLGVTAIILIVFGVLLGAAINYGMNGPTSDQIDALHKSVDTLPAAQKNNIKIFVNFLYGSMYVPPVATGIIGLSLFALHPELNPFKLF